MPNMTQKIQSFCKKSPYHAVFVGQAVEFYSQHILANEQSVKDDLNKQGLIRGEDWIELARESKELND